MTQRILNLRSALASAFAAKCIIFCVFRHTFLGRVYELVRAEDLSLSLFVTFKYNWDNSVFAKDQLYVRAMYRHRISLTKTVPVEEHSCSRRRESEYQEADVILRVLTRAVKNIDFREIMIFLWTIPGAEIL